MRYDVTLSAQQMQDISDALDIAKADALETCEVFSLTDSVKVNAAALRRTRLEKLSAYLKHIKEEQQNYV